MFLYPGGLSILWLGFALILLAVSHSKTCMSELSLSQKNLWLRLWTFGGMIVAAIGVRSYSIYVWHGYWAKPISNRITKILGLTGTDPIFGFLHELVYLGVPIALGSLSFALIEEPFLKLRERFS